jgi:hypothetical protein
VQTRQFGLATSEVAGVVRQLPVWARWCAPPQPTKTPPACCASS